MDGLRNHTVGILSEIEEIEMIFVDKLNNIMRNK